MSAASARLLSLLLLAPVLALAIARPGLRADDGVFSEKDFDEHMRQVVPRDAFPVLFDPPMVAAKDVGGKLRDEDLVIGIAMKDEAKAYPVQVMGVHELVNDEIGGVPIAVSW